MAAVTHRLPKHLAGSFDGRKFPRWIHRLHRAAKRRREFGGIDAGTRDDRHLRARRLLKRLVDFRRRRVLITVVAHIAHHPGHREPRTSASPRKVHVPRDTLPLTRSTTSAVPWRLAVESWLWARPVKTRSPGRPMYLCNKA